MRSTPDNTPCSRKSRRGAVAVEYILLLTLIAIGSLVGLASLRDAIVDELTDLAMAIASITP
ncbi:MAG: Flp family type IVb pilin [Planctomycetota bacterium]